MADLLAYQDMDEFVDALTGLSSPTARRNPRCLPNVPTEAIPQRPPQAGPGGALFACQSPQEQVDIAIPLRGPLGSSHSREPQKSGSPEFTSRNRITEEDEDNAHVFRHLRMLTADGTAPSHPSSELDLVNPSVRSLRAAARTQGPGTVERHSEPQFTNHHGAIRTRFDGWGFRIHMNQSGGDANGNPSPTTFQQ